MASASLSRRASFAATLALCVLALAGVAQAKVFFSKEEALKLAFPDADRVESRSYLLNDDEAARVEALSKAPLETRLVTVHTGRKGEQILGYAVIDSHVVRTLPAAFMILLSPKGAVRSLRVLAFYEPEDYLPTTRWLGQFEGKNPGDEPTLRREIHGIAGATLSSGAVTGAVGRALAYYEVLVEPGALARQ